MSGTKVFKRGDLLCKEGEPIQSLVVLKSGGVTQQLSRGKKHVDFFQLGAGTMIGDTVFFGANTHQFNSIVTSEAKVEEFQVSQVQKMLDSAPVLVQLLVKSLTEKLKIAISDLRNFKSETSAVPCPEDSVAKAFACIYHAAAKKGEKQKDGKIKVDWLSLKHYVFRLFAEPQKRTENICVILQKLGLAQIVMGKNPTQPDGPEEMQEVIFFDLAPIEGFFEFFQYYYFKGGKTDLLKSDETSTALLRLFLDLSAETAPDRFGVVTLDYTDLVQKVKERLGWTLNNDRLNRLEQKGVMFKRRTTTDGQTQLQFERKELVAMVAYWKILREIEKWNEKGYVDPNEREEFGKKAPTGPVCGQCQTQFTPGAKFCSQCGAKIESAA